jgi:alpha-2-macroglobulin
MSKRLLLALAAFVIITLAAIPFIAQKGNTAVGETKVNPAFSAYVSAYTSGIISNESVIRIRLANDLQTGVTLDQEVTEKYFDFSPSIEGKTYWIDSRTLEFRPAKRMPSNQAYKAEFFLDKLLSDLPKDLRTMEFSFHTMRQGFEVNIDGMKTTDKKTLRKQQLRGSLTTADAADKEVIEKIVSVSQNGKKLAIRWEHEGDNVNHHFVVDDIVRSEKAGEVEISWDGTPLGVDQKKTEKLPIPSIKDFKVMDAKVTQAPEQFVSVQFSDPIDEKQNLDGLITVSGATSLRFSVEDNEVRVYPGEVLNGSHNIQVNPGIRNVLGFKLPHAFSQPVTFEELKPAVRILGKGVILPNSGRGLLMPFEAVSLRSVDVKIIRIFENNIPQFLQVNSLDGSREMKRVGKVVIKKKIDLNIKNPSDLGRWNMYSLDLGELIKAEPGAIYKVYIGFKKAYSTYSCDAAEDDQDSMEEVATEMSEDEDDGSGYSYYGDYDGEDYYYYDDDNSDPCSRSYYYGKTVSRNILASDMGLLAKRGNDGNLIFAVNDLRTTLPLANVDFEVYDFQQQLLGTVKSDAQGLAKLQLKKKPFLLVAKNGTQRGYLKLDDGSSLSLSAFDVSGATVQKGLKGMIYGERGVWRPGDTLFLGFILEDKQKSLPATHPVSFELVNPRGQVVKKSVQSKSMNGFYNFTTPTDADASTGLWMARVKVGGAVFTKDLKVETIMPNRLKINLGFGNQEMFTKSSDQKGSLDVKWLHGAIAKSLSTKVEVNLYETPTKFKGYDNYVFDDPASNFYTENQMVYDGRLDENGKADFTPELKAENAPGMMRASFTTRVFEESGAFSTDRFSINYSPYDNYVGMLLPKGSGWYDMLETDKDHVVQIVTVDPKGKPVSRPKLSVKVYKVDWRWWWSSDDNLSHYVNSTYYSPYSEQEISTTNGRGTFKLRVNEPEWGRFLVRITDEETGHSTGQVVYFDWPYWKGSAMKNSEAATMLQFQSDKTNYKVGETMKLSIPSPGQGRALITVESGSKVLDAYWAETQTKGTISYSIPVTPAMAPNVYVSVTLIQPHAQTKNDAPIRLYGTIPVIVDDPNTHLSPEIATAAVWKPEEQASVTVSEKDGKAMTYTLAVVDEGLLDLTRFKTPDPWNTFYAREALGVKTWDMYDLVMGAYGAELERVLGIGGDGDAGSKGGQKANRFKPMVRFMGPFELKKGEKQTKTFMMPQYVGSVRVMVIAGQDGAYGNVEKAVPVRKPLMILGTLPRVVGPGETVDLPVDVFAMEKKVKNVSVSIAPNAFFTIDGPASKNLTFNQVGDEVVTFRLNVAKAVGVGKVKITATGGGEKAVYEIELDVRNPNPRVSNVIEATVAPGQSWTSPYTPAGIAGTNEGILELSTMPPINFGQRLNYLIHYPYGCIEQTTSSVFPQLFVGDVMKLNENMKKRTERNIKAGIDRLRKFQTSSGGMGYWPGDNEPSDWGTNYAGHFLLEAEAKGYAIPQGMMDNWKRFQRQRAASWTASSDPNYYYSSDVIQAYRLYTLALAKSPELGAMNRLREVKKLSDAAKWRLAAAYQLAGQTEVAKQLIVGLSTDIKPYAELSYSYGSDARDEAMILETLSLMGGSMRAKALPLARTLAQSLNRPSYWMSTQTTAYCLIAMIKFSGADKTTAGVNCSYTIDGKAGTIAGKEPMAQQEMEIKDAKSGKVTVKNTGTSEIFVRLILSGIPEAGEEQAAANDLTIDVSFTSTDGLPIDVSKLEQGTDFIAVVTVGNPGLRGEYKEMGLTQIFPSGWEIRNVRMDEGVSTLKSDPSDYQDIRDDRVNTFFWLGPQKSKTFRIQLNATYAGRYYLPSFSCEAMYDHSIYARNAGQWIEVVNGLPGT